jgi:hypothetical protein
MKRRNFISKNVLAVVSLPIGYASLGLSNQKSDDYTSSTSSPGASNQKIEGYASTDDEVIIERL